MLKYSMNIFNIIKDTQDFKSLCSEIKANTISKSILLFSKDSFYAEEFSKALAVSLLNNGEMEENENYLKVISNSHPDVKTYPQKDKLLVSDSEEIVMESFIKPIFSDKKIFIIKNIDNSMESAQNKLLKVLEEPPCNVYFIITCVNENLLLPTIKSRCSKFELSKIDRLLIEKELGSVSEKELISSICDGKLGKAIDIAEKKNVREIFDLAVSLLVEMKSSKQVLLFSNKISKIKNEYNLLFEILCLLLEDLLFIKAGENQKARFKDALSKLESVSIEYSIKAICEIQSLIDKAVKEMSYNGNVTLIIENLLLNILEVKYICR